MLLVLKPELKLEVELERILETLERELKLEAELRRVLQQLSWAETEG